MQGQGQGQGQVQVQVQGLGPGQGPGTPGLTRASPEMALPWAPPGGPPASSGRRREVLPNDFRGSVDLQLPEVFQSLWDMGITFGMDRLVLADGNSTQSSGTPLVDPLASVRGSQHSAHGMGNAAGAEAGAEANLKTRADTGAEEILRTGTDPGAEANLRTGADTGAGSHAEAWVDLEAGEAAGAGADTETRARAQCSGSLGASGSGESEVQSSSQSDHPPPLRLASLPELLPRFGLVDPGSPKTEPGDSGEAPLGNAGCGRTVVAGDWKTTVGPQVPAEVAVAATDRGAQDRSSAKPLPYKNPPPTSLSLRLAAALDAIQEPWADPGGTARGRMKRLAGARPEGSTPTAGARAGAGAEAAAGVLLPRSTQGASGALPAAGPVAGPAARAQGAAEGSLGGALDLPQMGYPGTVLSPPVRRSSACAQLESWEGWQERSLSQAVLAQGEGPRDGQGAGLGGEQGEGPRVGQGEGQGGQQREGQVRAQGPGAGGQSQGTREESSLSLRLAAALTSFGKPPERKRRLVLLSGPSRVVDVRKAMRTRQVPSHVPHGLVESLPHAPFAGGSAATSMRKRLMLAAEAVQAGNYALFEDLRSQLVRFAKPRGVAMERIVHVMLKALDFRLKGGVTQHINTVPGVTSLQTVAKAVVWFVTVHPASIFSCKSVTAMIVPVLARKQRPHILISNPSSFAELAVIMRILAEQWHMRGTGAGEPGTTASGVPFAEPGMPDTQPGMAASPPGTSSSAPESSSSSASGPTVQHQQSSDSSGSEGDPAATPDAPGGFQEGVPGPQDSAGAESSPKERLRIRITYMDLWPLVRPGRTDISSEGMWEFVGVMLRQAAGPMGVDLEFSTLRITRENPDVIDQIEVEKGETFVACLLHEFKFLPSAPGKGGLLQRFIKKLVSLKPAMVAFQEENVECTGEDFVSRFGASMDYFWLALDQNDACTGGKGRKWMHLVEPGFHHECVYSICAPDGERMSVQYHTWEEWDRLWRLWGFQKKAVRPDLIEPMRKLLANYPAGYGVQAESNWVSLTWNGRRTTIISFWTLS